LTTLKQHHHLGHLNIKSLNPMHFHNMVIGLLDLNIFSSFCEGCIFEKHFKSPYPTTLVTQATEPFIFDPY